MRTFSGTDMENPGDCSPSLSVVSEMRTICMVLSHSTHSTPERQADQIYNSCEFYKVKLYQQLPARMSVCAHPGSVALARRGGRASVRPPVPGGTACRATAQSL